MIGKAIKREAYIRPIGFSKVKKFKKWALTSLTQAKHYSAVAFRPDFFADAARLKDIKYPDETFFLGT